MANKRVFGDLIGQKFGKFTVIQAAEPIRSQIQVKDKDHNPVRDESGQFVYKQGKTEYPAWLCKCECGNEVVVKEIDLKKGSAKGFSCGCANKLKSDYAKKGLMSEDDKLDWAELYEYVRKEVMGYSVQMALTTKMVLRLKGMQDGQKIKNLKTQPRAYYPFKVILNSFKYSLPAIQRANKKKFYNEDLRFNYLCAIVESNLNIVFLKMEQKLKEKAELEKIAASPDPSYVPLYAYEYKKKETREKNLKGYLDDIL